MVRRASQRFVHGSRPALSALRVLICATTSLFAGSSAAEVLAPGRPLRLEQLPSPGAVRHLAATPDGLIWAAIDGQVYRFVGRESRVVTESGLANGAPMAFDTGPLLVASDETHPRGARVFAMDGSGTLASGLRGLGDAETRLRVTSWIGPVGRPEALTTRRGLVVRGAATIADELWLATESGLEVIETRQTEARVVRAGTSFSAVAAADGVVVAGTNDGTVVRVVGRETTTLATLPAPVRRLAPLDRKRVWVGTDRGAFLLDDRTIEQQIDEFAGLPSAEVTALAVDRDASVWVGTRHGLWSRGRDGRVVTFDTSTGLPGNSITALAVDREGTIWVGSDASALALVKRANAWTVPAAKGWPGRPSRALAKTRNGDIWVAAADGLWRARSDGDEVEMVRATGSVELGNATLLAADPIAGFWGIFDGELHGSTIRHVAEQGPAAVIGGAKVGPPGASLDGLRATPTWLLCSDPSTLWVGHSDGALDRYAIEREGRGRPLRVQHRQRLSPHSTRLCTGPIVAGALDADGTLWLASHGGGLGSVTRSLATGCLTRGQGLPRDHVTGVVALVEGQKVWASLNHDGGVVRVARGAIAEHLRESDGLECDSILAMHHDPRTRRVVMACAAGVLARHEALLSAARPRGEERSFWTIPEDIEAAVAAPTSAALTTDERGRVWAIADGRLTVLFPPQPGTAATVAAKSILVDTVWLDGKLIPPPFERLEVTAARVSLAAHLAVPTTARADAIRFRYRLRSDPTSPWSYVPARGRIVLLELETGTNQVEVDLSVDHGRSWGHGATMSVLVSRPLARRAGFWLLLGSATGGLAIALAVMLARARSRRERAARDAVEAERARIARNLHDGPSQGFIAARLLVDAALQKLESEPRRADEVLRSLHRVLDKQVATARQLIARLRDEAPVPLRSLHACLVELVESARLPAAAKEIELATDFPSDPARLDELAERALGAERQQELVAILEEALANAIKHSASAVVTLRVQIDATLVFIVDDRGRGFEERLARNGTFGLRGMAERARAAELRLTIETAPGAGTRIRVDVEPP